MSSTRLSEMEIIDQMKIFSANPALAANQDLIVAPGVGFKFVIYGYCVNGTGGANTFVFTRGAGPTAISSVKAVPASGNNNVPPSLVALHECGENEKLGVTLSAATAVGVDIWYLLQRVTP